MGWRVPQPRDLLPRRITFERSRHLGGLSQPRWSRVRGLVWRHNWPRSPRIQNLTAVVVMTGGQRASSPLAKEVPRHAIGRRCTERTDGRQKRGLKPLGRDSLTAHYIPNPFNEVATVWLVKLLQSAVRRPLSAAAQKNASNSFLDRSCMLPAQTRMRDLGSGSGFSNTEGLSIFSRLAGAIFRRDNLTWQPASISQVCGGPPQSFSAWLSDQHGGGRCSSLPEWRPAFYLM